MPHPVAGCGRAGLAPPVLRCDPAARVLVTRGSSGPVRQPGARTRRPLERLARMLAESACDAGAAAICARWISPPRPGCSSTRCARHSSRRLQRNRRRFCASCDESRAARALPQRPQSAEHRRGSRSGALARRLGVRGAGDAVFDLASCASQHRCTPRSATGSWQSYESAGGSLRPAPLRSGRAGDSTTCSGSGTRVSAAGDASPSARSAEERAARLAQYVTRACKRPPALQ